MKIKTDQTQGERIQGSGQQRIVPQNSEVLEHPSMWEKEHENTASWPWGEKRIQMLQGFAVWASSHQIVLVFPAGGISPVPAPALLV